MAGVRDSLGRVGHDLLAQALGACGRDGFTGELRVTGVPGGTFHLRGGLVVAVESAGAPGAEALLLRTGRVAGEQWAELVREAGGERWPAAGLIARGCAGAAELRVLCVMALQDAAFAISAGWIDGCERAEAAGTPPAAIAVGEQPTRLLQEAARKLAALDTLPFPVRPDRERPAPVARPAGRLSALQEELLLHADGRRTARDLAFRTGRGVYTVTVEIARMLGEGVVECADRPVPIPVRLPPGDAAVRRRRPVPRTSEPATPAATAAATAAVTAAERSRSGGSPAPGPGTASDAGAATGHGRSASTAPAPALLTSPTPSPAPARASEPTTVPRPLPALSRGPGRSSGPATPHPPPAPAPPADVDGWGRGGSSAGGGTDPGAASPAGPPRPEASAGAGRPAVREAATRSEAPDAGSLPRRTPGASGITEALTPQQNGASWKGFFRLWAADRRVPKQPEHRDQQMES